jgi:ribosome-associated toxin RatA of RatAB toxin-antitoxin module
MAKVANWVRCFGVVATLGSATLSASADTPQGRTVERYNVKASGISGAGASANVQASRDTVRAVITDFGRYDEFMKPFQSSKIVGRSGDKTHVYFTVPILKGLNKIWAVLQVSPPTTAGPDEVVSGKMLKGNVRRLSAVWRLRSLDDKNTRLTLELYVDSGLPLPDSFVQSELNSAVASALKGARAEAERRTQP